MSTLVNYAEHEALARHGAEHEWGDKEDVIHIQGGAKHVDSLGSRLWTMLRADPLSSLFFALYILIAVATFRHSMIGFASIESGSSMTALLWGAMAALAIDAGMILSATGLRRDQTRARRAALIIGLVLAALASIFTQLLYAMMHAQSIEVSAGAGWMQDTATWIIQRRILIMPSLLPVLAIVYSFSAKAGVNPKRENQDKGGAVRSPDTPQTKESQCIESWIEHGLDTSARVVADAVGCHITTANRVRRAMRDAENTQ